ncbi:UdgX family uracil-DNA binding protein [Rhizobium halophytocola]|uniref:Type-4 uracil-DNA glycosylase n=1 Tax=Rhizobium halophytocola TaxID=735519 RepID=A0ABS4E414_9HYPH|nr:UdgX family uracil-DNA binding protein [Rhizobium halophytocola]MBP1852651.1 DNA polymerase [Rhizobium halophytocola]
MRTIELCGGSDFDAWRNAARQLLLSGVSPADIVWRVRDGAAPGLFDGKEAVEPGAEAAAPTSETQISVSRLYIDKATAAICHSDPARFDLLYRLLFRLQMHRALVGDAADPDVVLLDRLVKSVRRDCHKMKAFVRFKEIDQKEGGRRRFVAWFEPDHFIVARTAPFFARRFADMDWLISTPKGSAAWNGETLKVDSAPGTREAVEDEADELWRIYFANIFNPARLKVKAMQAEMPKKYWKNLPEARLIPDLIANAEARSRSMAQAAPTVAPAFHDRLQADWDAARKRSNSVPDDPMQALQTELGACRRCPLHLPATQTVCGEGPVEAEMMFVGEQPGDQEDLAGRPFIGPAGKVFDEALLMAGIARKGVYVTNAVKHFKYEPRGKRRIHQKPNMGEIQHCRWWLDREIALVKPKIIVAMGATAFFALTGEKKAMGEVRGMPIPIEAGRMLFVTVHPAYLLRIPEPQRRAEELERFHADIGSLARLSAVA